MKEELYIVILAAIAKIRQLGGIRDVLSESLKFVHGFSFRYRKIKDC